MKCFIESLRVLDSNNEEDCKDLDLDQIYNLINMIISDGFRIEVISTHSI